MICSFHYFTLYVYVAFVFINYVMTSKVSSKVSNKDMTLWFILPQKVVLETGLQ